MTRTEEREQAFILVFEKAFNMEMSLEDIIACAAEAGPFEKSDFAFGLAGSTYENLEEIDRVIETYAIGWRKNRLSKVTLSLLRLALCEIMFGKDVPVSVSINEAVVLAKKYATQEDAVFINGILGVYVRSRAT